MQKLTLDDLNPSNLKNLTDEQLATLRDLTDAEIQELGNKYPNKPTENNYLVLEDTRKNAKQLHNTSSWKNLADLRGPLSQKFWVVRTIKSRFSAPKVQPEGKIQDLTNQEAKGAEGVKKVGETQKLTALPGGQNGTDKGAGDEKGTEAPKQDLTNQEAKTDVAGAEKTDLTNTASTEVKDEANKTDEFSETDVNDDEAALKELAQKNAAAGNKGTGTAKGAANKPK